MSASESAPMLRAEDFSLCAAPFTPAAVRLSHAVMISEMRTNPAHDSA